MFYIDFCIFLKAQEDSILYEADHKCDGTVHVHPSQGIIQDIFFGGGGCRCVQRRQCTN